MTVRTPYKHKTKQYECDAADVSTTVSMLLLVSKYSITTTFFLIAFNFSSNIMPHRTTQS